MLEIKMKKFVVTVILALFGHSVFALDNPSFSINEQDSQKGTLSMQDLYIGGIKSFEDVKIEFDFSNSTFKLLEITEADNRIPTNPIENITAEGITVGLRGCISENRVITCHLTITSNEFDRTLNFCANTSSSSSCANDNSSTAFDNLNNSYTASKVTLANESSVRIVEKVLLVADIPTEATIEFSNLSTRATALSLMILGFQASPRAYFSVEFRDIEF